MQTLLHSPVLLFLYLYDLFVNEINCRVPL